MPSRHRNAVHTTMYSALTKCAYQLMYRHVLQHNAHRRRDVTAAPAAARVACVTWRGAEVAAPLASTGSPANTNTPSRRRRRGGIRTAVPMPTNAAGAGRHVSGNGSFTTVLNTT